ncbi:MAG: D-aminoacylase [Cytophagia bacterium]|nr:D-aminoacylase [Cytophagia bacterium]
MKKIFPLLLALLCACSSTSEKFDILITNGSIYDAENRTFYEGDIGITGDKIDEIGDLRGASAKRTIDASGHIVSPGFIDMHSHIEAIMRMPDAENVVKQGVTTVLAGPDGRGPSPMKPFLDSLETFELGINTAWLVGHNSIRRNVMGTENRAPTDEELAEMEAAVQEAMDNGAYGISTGLKYVPGSFSEIDEVIALSKVAAKTGGIYTSHLREEGLGLLEGVGEAIQIGHDADIPIILTHHKAIGRPMWGASTKTLAMVDSARALGIDVMMDQYPYTASSTGLSVLIPTWAMAGGQEEFKKRVNDPATRKKIHDEIMFNIEYDRGGADLDVVQFANVSWKPDLNGRTLKDWAIEKGLEPNFKNGADLVIEGQLNGGASCIFHAIGEEDVKRIMQHPLAMVASDGGLARPGVGHPHPRSYGTFPRVLGHYVRDEQVIPLELALAKMTSLPAERLGLTDRGYIKEDMQADIAIFDPETVNEGGTFEDPHHYPVGIPFVIVNGTVTVDSGELTEGRAGRVLRKK